MTRSIFNALLTTLALAPMLAFAHGDVECKVPSAEWRPKGELAAKLEKEGWTIRKLKVDNGCYEVYGFDGKGAKRESYFNPKTLEVVTDMLQK